MASSFGHTGTGPVGATPSACSSAGSLRSRMRVTRSSASLSGFGGSGGSPGSLTLAELVETYLAQHDVQPVTIEKLRYLLSKATAFSAIAKSGS